MDSRNWRQEFTELEITLSNSKQSDRNHLLRLIHPTLIVFLRKNENLTSDKIDHVFRIYNIVCVQWKEYIDPLISQEILEGISAVLFRLSDVANKHNLPWSCLSEECCLTLARVIRASILVSVQRPSNVLLYSAKNLPLLSHMCSTLLEMSEFASWRAVRLESLGALKVLFRPSDQISKRSSLVKIRKSVTHFLPGVCQTLHRIVTGDQKIGSLVKELSLDTWAVCLTVVFAQVDPVCSPNGDSTASDTQATTMPRPDSSLFSKEWYDTTVPRLQVLIQNTVDNFLHVQLNSDAVDGDRMSIAFIRWLSALLSDCIPSIERQLALPLRNTVVSGLVSLAARNSPSDWTEKTLETQGSVLARDALLHFVKRSDEPVTGSSLPEALNGSRLIRKITIEAVSNQIALLTMHMPISVDANSLSVLASSRDLLHRFCAGLAEFLAFHISCVELFGDSSTSANSLTVLPPHQGNRIRFPNTFVKSFQQFRDPKTLLMVQSVAARIASQDDTVDLFMETCQDVMLLSSGLHRNPCLLLMLSGLAGYLHNGTFHFVGFVLVLNFSHFWWAYFQH
ncbi:unnamed protein product [Echinostoma caproni]|uniref:DUF2428 domain-containing protein n=1 Tax=Echinostoma caproni TaxID=27848 RepID=A0A183B5C4_9TREM|nr:unnamed protein product [Echinostoma caproni]